MGFRPNIFDPRLWLGQVGSAFSFGVRARLKPAGVCPGGKNYFIGDLILTFWASPCKDYHQGPG